MKLDTLLQALPALKSAELNPEITGLCYDSRQAKAGSLYACLPGTRADGHQFIPQALAQGAVAVLCQNDWLQQQSDLSPEIAWIGVEETRVALAQLAAAFYDFPSRKLALVGVTGTNGKTTTTHLIRSLLEKAGQATGLIGTLGCFFGASEIPTGFTTPFAPELQQILAQMQQEGAQTVTMECSSHALEQHRLDALEFECAIFTNLTQDHLDYHKTMEAYASAKQILFKHLLKAQGTALLNSDDPYAESFAQSCSGKILRYGFGSEADLRASDPVYGLAGVSYLLHWQGKIWPVRLALPGHYNILNSLAALGAGLVLGQDLPSLIENLAQIPGVPGRLEVVSPANHPFTVAVDYAHTPDSLENVLKTARQFTPGRLLCVFGCGGDRDASKRPLMGKAASELADHAWLTSDNPRSEDPEAILNDILAGIDQPEKVTREVDRQTAIESALQAAQPGDVLIIAGKGHETYQIFKDRTVHFDDREVARQWLERN
ncbi:UDP-N-acetylmuramoyl-L-alanyl-D-glutamate--2,6-diaminopimelate ligase [bacterium (Candidatus Blackallbacteria) CG17_big_fil_post_rev_8_21_14_2_50_48_46]|uniref:UDP-N-acetylmuramoyl-L-alanyl-D-glutamate--2,6-diaminopimelate ligase n=1 Tax=bacterium (Candidatus Blackallbacteria) CG17_big_fil_post_rev_8_21_14_2_50_48_46 TaxID=2014261 RepID=A0A2M7FY50_9BACT|nr:MAG: UDP-N-acetylmuramoyl-L-alanyl-D-glutamate--2,6-diaminopimelate ligase [bacterium (Candidatus Blackallbacteria) CG18_big_fil_WC_8_21_14_2_50_49_26]PIW14102.1 MAG: UDP-N-acetylmuramoyl-L-alanyl-D-glutamate--2,6-diaminopimelate ligase [bacterium (Candidatus Blackallbacteria) CG17_big_fil_post_rev_8_21_14_2_50_48_46]PIW45832.1 MAG: UDP-N-acetylmuramoyl-L-alanyl-D-glutamate--2,6-diaminopimelate ligase [bacterium (Candidatus Blackallbacteria) CG13_big_fil_rev_8_21_14_2_50_49_14]